MELIAAEKNLQAIVQNEFTSLEIARTKWQSARRQQAYLEEAVLQKEEFVMSQQAVYQSGRIPLSELMSQETELLQLNMRERSLSYTERRNAINYYSAAGQLTEEIIYNILGRTN